MTYKKNLQVNSKSVCCMILIIDSKKPSIYFVEQK